MLEASTRPASRRFSLQHQEIDTLVQQFGVQDQAAAFEAVVGPVIALAGALIAENRSAADEAIQALKEASPDLDALDQVVGVATVLVRHTPIVSSCLSVKAPAFARLTHPAGVHALLQGELDLFAS